MAIITCCLEVTSWTMQETDLEFKIIRASDVTEPNNTSNPEHPSNAFPGTSWKWIYTEAKPGKERVVSTLKKQAAFIATAPTSNGCINTCGGDLGAKTPVGGPVQHGPTHLYEVSYMGYWRKVSGFGPFLIRGKHIITVKRIFTKTRFNQDYTYLHLCGRNCPPCNGIKEFDDIDKICNEWNNWKPKV